MDSYQKTNCYAVYILYQDMYEPFLSHKYIFELTHTFFKKGRVIAVCEDNSLQVWEISSDNSILKCVHSQSLEGK